MAVQPIPTARSIAVATPPIVGTWDPRSGITSDFVVLVTGMKGMKKMEDQDL
jgi:hypothetical protein